MANFVKNYEEQKTYEIEQDKKKKKKGPAKVIKIPKKKLKSLTTDTFIFINIYLVFLCKV